VPRSSIRPRWWSGRAAPPRWPRRRDQGSHGGAASRRRIREVRIREVRIREVRIREVGIREVRIRGRAHGFRPSAGIVLHHAPDPGSAAHVAMSTNRAPVARDLPDCCEAWLGDGGNVRNCCFVTVTIQIGSVPFRPWWSPAGVGFRVIAVEGSGDVYGSGAQVALAGRGTVRPCLCGRRRC
jgi:hypothetical protein